MPMPLPFASRSRNRYRKWLVEYNNCRKRGVRLLFEFYKIPELGIEGREAQFRELFFALARDCVPYFSIRKKKGSKWDWHVRARFLRDVVNGRKVGKSLELAVNSAKRNLPAELRNSTNGALAGC